MKKLTSQQCLIYCIISIIIGIICLIFGKNSIVKNMIYIFCFISVVFLMYWFLKERQYDNEQLQHEIMQLTEKAEECAAAANTTDTLRDFVYYWDRLIGYMQKIKDYKIQPSPNNSINFEFDDLKSQEQKHIRDAIKREYHNIVNKYSKDSDLYDICYDIFSKEIEMYSDRLDTTSLQVANDYKAMLRTKTYNKPHEEQNTEFSQKFNGVLSDDKLIEYELLEVDLMSNSGWEFEEYTSKLLLYNGFSSAETTSKSNDYGADVIAVNTDGVKYAIQCKCYSEPVGNKSVQEIVAAMQFYNCHVGVVLTNNYFTNNAISLAKTNGVLLWDRNKLKEMIENKVKRLGVNKDNLQAQLPDIEHDGDPLLKDAIIIAIELGKISTSMIQRRLGIGYARAGRIIDQMAEKGVISADDGTKPRDVLITDDDLDSLNL